MGSARRTRNPLSEADENIKTYFETRISIWNNGHHFHNIHNQQPVYTHTFLDFVSKVKFQSRFGREPEYVFIDGLDNPKFCTENLELDISPELRSFGTRDYAHAMKTDIYIPRRARFDLPTYKSPRTIWGIDLKKIKPVIPYNLESVRKQQKEMTPLTHWINTHKATFERNKPQFVSNRFILKRIMSMNTTEGPISFIAEKIDGTIYLREYDVAFRSVSPSSCGSLFESAILGNTDNKKKFDLNESTYGIYTGRVQNITVLFSAEIDAFWDEKTSESESPKKDVQSKMIVGDKECRVAEIKTMSRDLFAGFLGEKFKSLFSSAWAQCYLIGVDKILYGIVDKKKIAQLQFIELEEIQKHLTGWEEWDNCTKSGPGVCTQRLHDTLSKIMDHVMEDSPTQYLVTTIFVTRRRRIDTRITKITRQICHSPLVL